MTTPLLKFARSFEQLKLRLQTQPAGDLRLLLLAEYWPNLRQYTGISGYRSYFDEFVPFLIDHIDTKNLSDLHPLELKALLEAVLSLNQIGPDQYGTDIDKEIIELVGIETARKFFYVGAHSDGLDCLARALRIELPTLVPPESDGQLSEIDMLKMAQSQLIESSNQLADPVERIVREWEIIREALSFEEANCLFVEKGEQADFVRGRLRSLLGGAEYNRKGTKTDEVTFDNQIKAPDDPFVGAVYGALKAVAKLTEQSGIRVHKENRIRARFGIVGSDHTFTGDSIGLAAALVIYTQLLQPEILRHERFIACEAAFTGGVDANGYLQPVNNDTLQAKIGRAFFSPVRYVVLPNANLEAAREFVAELETDYPCRRLLLRGARTLADIVENRNIIRAEKVCAGRYAIRKAHRYGRLVKIQIPLLLLLLYVLICMVYPKAWIGFDWNPENVRLSEAHDELLAFNKDSDLLWSKDIDCSPVGNLFAEAYDLDADGRNEVLYIKHLTENMPCSTSAQLAVRDDNGDLLFTRNCNIVGEYPGDSSSTQFYEGRRLYIFESATGPVIVTIFVEDNPARAHLKVWSSKGELMGWYVHSGHAGLITIGDINGDGYKELLGVGINNRAGGSGLFVLPIKGSYGVSPPYADLSVDLSNVRRGNQLHYILFPTSDLALADSIPYDCGSHIALLPGGNLRIDILVSTSSPIWRSYFMNSKQHVYRITPSDQFWLYRQKFVEGGYLPPMDLQDFCQWERERVRYWSADGWVSGAELDDIHIQ